MTLPNHALQAGRATPRQANDSAANLLLAGGGGALGSVVLERLLGSDQFAQVCVLATRNLTVAMQGLAPVIVDSFDEPPAAGAAPLAQTAVIVFDRERHAGGRELAFLRPRAEDLAALSRWLWQRGVRELVVVSPDAPAALPHALMAGLANLDEQAVTALGFDHLVFVRTARPNVATHTRPWLQRVADNVLAQLQVMVAASNQPLRARKVAEFVDALVRQLPLSAPGTRIAPPELLWRCAQLRDPAVLVQAWLTGHALPEIKAPRVRM